MACTAGKAWQTPLGRYACQQAGKEFTVGQACAVVLQVPLEGLLSKAGGVQFVLKRPQGQQPEWLSGPGKKDFFVSFDEVMLWVSPMPIQYCAVPTPQSQSDS